MKEGRSFTSLTLIGMLFHNLAQKGFNYYLAVHINKIICNIKFYIFVFGFVFFFDKINYLVHCPTRSSRHHSYLGKPNSE